MNSQMIEQWKNIETNDKILNEELSKKTNLEKLFIGKPFFRMNGFFAKMGAGTKKINIHTIKLIATALAKKYKNNNNILIGHDNRKNGKLFSEEISKVLNSFGIKSTFFENNNSKPSALMSFGIKTCNLDGGVYIGGSIHEKNMNGIRLFDEDGQEYNISEYDKINNFIKSTNFTYKNYPWSDFNFLDISIENKYVEFISSFAKEKGSLKVAATSLNGTSGEFIKKICQRSGNEVFFPKKELKDDPEFSSVKSLNPSDAKSYKRVYRLAARKKVDLGIATDTEGRELGVFVKHKKRYKFLKPEDVVSLHLEYKLNKLKKSNSLSKDSYIVKSKFSGELPVKIAASYGVRVIEMDCDVINVKEIAKNEKGTFILGYDDNLSMIFNQNLFPTRDAIHTIISIIDTCKYFKNKGESLYGALKEIWKKYGIHRTVSYDKKVKKNIFNNLIKKIKTSKEIEGFSVEKDKTEIYKDYTGTKEVKIFFKSGSWLGMRYTDLLINNLKITTQAIGNKNQELMDIVVFEKQMSSWIGNNTEVFENAKWSWRSFFKYILFISFIVGILSFVFLMVYQDASKVNVKGNTSISPYSMASIIANSSPTRWVWLSLWGWSIISRIISAWKLKRMLLMQGERAKLKHLLASQVMGSVISFVTPFAVGGDAIGYWYMRRKGIKRGPLIATYATDTLLYQAKFTLQTFILAGVGIPIYKEIFLSSDVQSKAALVWFIVGSSWTIFATIMIFTLTLSKRFQEFCIRNALKLLEWSKLVVISDPGFKLARYQYEFWGIRKGMRDLWKRWWFALELLFYDLGPLFFNPATIVLISLGWVKKDIVGVNGYIGVIVIDDMVNTANSMSLTPGGSGTGEWLIQVTKKLVYQGSYDAQGITSGYDLMAKMFYSWPWLAFSALLVMSIVPLENYRGSRENAKGKRYKMFLKIIWLFSIGGFIAYFFSIF